MMTGKNIVWSTVVKRTAGKHRYVPARHNVTEIMLRMALTLYYTIPHFDALKIYSCQKHCEKRRNCWLNAVSPFLTTFSFLYGTYYTPTSKDWGHIVLPLSVRLSVCLHKLNMKT